MFEVTFDSPCKLCEDEPTRTTGPEAQAKYRCHNKWCPMNKVELTMHEWKCLMEGKEL